MDFASQNKEEHMKFNKYFDHTNLKPEATKDDIRTLCEEAKKYDFASVCVNGIYKNVFPEVMLRHVLLLDFRWEL